MYHRTLFTTLLLMLLGCATPQAALTGDSSTEPKLVRALHITASLNGKPAAVVTLMYEDHSIDLLLVVGNFTATEAKAITTAHARPATAEEARRYLDPACQELARSANTATPCTGFTWIVTASGTQELLLRRMPDMTVPANATSTGGVLLVQDQ